MIKHNSLPGTKITDISAFMLHSCYTFMPNEEEAQLFHVGKVVKFFSILWPLYTKIILIFTHQQNHEHLQKDDSRITEYENNICYAKGQ